MPAKPAVRIIVGELVAPATPSVAVDTTKPVAENLAPLTSPLEPSLNPALTELANRVQILEALNKKQADDLAILQSKMDEITASLQKK